MEAALLDLMPHEITLKPFASRSAYGTPTYGTAAPHRCLVERKQRLVKKSDGCEAISQTTVYVAGPVEITEQDEITLPDGTAPPVLAVETFYDETGAVHSAKVAF